MQIKTFAFLKVKISDNNILLLADVIASTDLDKPELVYGRIDASCEMLNKRFEPAIPLQRQYGDEVAGLFEATAPLYDVISHLREAAHPRAKLRFVAVRGKIGVVDRDISKVGGEVFKRASKQIDALKRKGRFGCLEINPDLDIALNALTQGSNYLIESMTARQREVYTLLKSERTHEQIARLLEVKRQAVGDAAKRGAAAIVLELEAAIRKLLGNS